MMMVKIICDDKNEKNLLLDMFDAYWQRHAEGREFKEMYGTFGMFDKYKGWITSLGGTIKPRKVKPTSWQCDL
jgi:hypothetical protein